MDVSNYFGIAGIVGIVLSGIFSFTNRERYKTLVAIYQQGNDELRKQNETLKGEKADCERAAAETQAKYDEQSKYVTKLEQLNLRPSAFADLSKTLANNHKEMMSKLTNLTSQIVKRSK